MSIGWHQHTKAKRRSSRIIRRRRCCCFCTERESQSQSQSKSKSKSKKGGEWRELPEELQERVLARLPVLEVFRLRCVCKAWNHILRSPNFFALHAPLEAWSVNITLIGAWVFIFMFDPATRRSFRLRFPQLDGLYYCYDAAASAGGLLCLPARPKDGEGDDPVETDFFVVNILTGSLRKLLRVPLQQQPLGEAKWCVRMSLMEEDSSIQKKKNTAYRVFLVYHSRRVAIYDSSTQAWKVGEAGSSPFPRFSRLTMVHGQLFATLPGEYPQFSLYDIDRQNWTNVELPLPSCQLGLSASVLLGCGNRRTVLLLPDLSPAGTCHGFAVWDLQQDPKSGKKKWVETARTPRAAQFATPQAEPLQLCPQFHSSRNFIVMTGSNADETKFVQPVLYDVSRDRWESLPRWDPWYEEIKHGWDSRKSGYVSLMLLEPNLAATP